MLQIDHICGSTWCIKGKSVCIPFYRLSGGGIVMIDSGLHSDGDEIVRLLEENRLSVRAVLTSHAHFDHVGNHNRLREKYGAEIYETLFDAGITQSLLTLRACFYTDRTELLAAAFPYMVITPDRVLFPNETLLSIDGAPFQILHLPGHALSHTGYVTPDGVAYLGDLLMGEEELSSRSLLFGVSWADTVQSVERVSGLASPYFVLAHGGVYSRLDALIEKNREAFERQAREIAALTADWKSRDQLLQAVHKRFHPHIRSTIQAHVLERIVIAALDYLEDVGRLELQTKNGTVQYREIMIKGKTEKVV